MSDAKDKTVRFAKDSTDYSVTHISTSVTVENTEDAVAKPEQESVETEAVLRSVDTSPSTTVIPRRRQGDSASTTGRECIRKLLQTVIDSSAIRYLLIVAALIVLIIVCDRFVIGQSPASTTTLGEELRSLLSKKLIQTLQESASLSATTPS